MTVESAPPVKVGRPRVRIEVSCTACGKKFEVRPSELERGGGRYCSAPCRDRHNGHSKAAKAIERPRTPKVERRCEGCGKTFKVYPYRATEARPARYCSHECLRLPPARKLSWRGHR